MNDPLPPSDDAPHPVTTLAVTVAPFWSRTCASLIDLIVPLGLWVVATWLIVSSDPEPPPVAPWNVIDQVVDYLHDRPGRSLVSGIAFLVLQVAWPLAFAGRTPGRRVMRLSLVGPDGRSLSLGRLFGWSLVRLPLLALGALGAWWAIVDSERRTLYDRAASVWLTRGERRGS